VAVAALSDKETDMPNESAVSVLYEEIFEYFGMQPDGYGGTPGFKLVFDDDRKVRVDYDGEDEIVWLTTPFAPAPRETLHRLLPKLLQLNFASAAERIAYGFDPDSGIVLLQSRVDGADVHFPDFEAALRRHLEIIGAARNELGAAGDGGASTQAFEDLPASAEPVIWG
jgi:Tir chaperone protein (CesT) family